MVKLFLLTAFGGCSLANAQISTDTDGHQDDHTYDFGTSAAGTSATDNNNMYKYNVPAPTSNSYLMIQSGYAFAGAQDATRREISSLLPPMEVSYDGSIYVIVPPGSEELKGFKVCDSTGCDGTESTLFAGGDGGNAMMQAALRPSSDGDNQGAPTEGLHYLAGDPWPRCLDADYSGDSYAGTGTPAACEAAITQLRAKWKFDLDTLATGNTAFVLFPMAGQITITGDGAAAVQSTCFGDDFGGSGNWTRISDDAYELRGSQAACDAHHTDGCLYWTPSETTSMNCEYNDNMAGAVVTFTPDRANLVLTPRSAGECEQWVTPVYFNDTAMTPLATPVNTCTAAGDGAFGAQCAEDSMSCKVPDLFFVEADYNAKSGEGGGGGEVGGENNGGSTACSWMTEAAGKVGCWDRDGTGTANGAPRTFDFEGGYYYDEVTLTPAEQLEDTDEEVDETTVMPQEVVCRCKTQMWVDLHAGPASAWFVKLNPYGPSLTNEGMSELSATLEIFRDSGYTIVYHIDQGALPRDTSEFYLRAKSNVASINIQVSNLVAGGSRNALGNDANRIALMKGYCFHPSFDCTHYKSGELETEVNDDDGEQLTMDSAYHHFSCKKFRFEGSKNVYFGARIASCEPATHCNTCTGAGGQYSDATLAFDDTTASEQEYNTGGHAPDGYIPTRRLQGQSAPQDKLTVVEMRVGEDAPTIREVLNGKTEQTGQNNVANTQKTRTARKKSSTATESADDATDSSSSSKRMYALIGAGVLVLGLAVVLAVNAYKKRDGRSKVPDISPRSGRFAGDLSSGDKSTAQPNKYANKVDISKTESPLDVL